MSDTPNSSLTPGSATATSAPAEVVGRNEPCPCGSGKKYKRCHGVDAAPKLTTPAGGAMQSPLPGFDPSAIDPQMMQQMTSALQRLPRAQLAKLQNMVQRATAGHDVTREAAELQKMLPPEFAAMAQIWGNQLMAQHGATAEAEAAAAEEASKPMTEEEAKRIIAEAAAAGKVSEDQAKDLIGEDPSKLLEAAKQDEGGISKFWSKVRGKS